MKKTILALVTLIALASHSSCTGIPVIDISSIAQEIKSGLQQIQSYLLQVQQFETQLMQWKNQILQATGLPQALQIYRDATGTIAQVQSVAAVFTSPGGLQGYMNNARTINFWLSQIPSPQNSSQSASYWSTTQQTANQALVKEIQSQQAELQADSATLQKLQTQAPTIQTQQQALNLATEISSLGTKSMIEMRTLMTSQLQQVAARQGSDTTNQSMRQAATQTFFGTQVAAQPHTGYQP
jgi:type IV secretion system protein TrbJ